MTFFFKQKQQAENWTDEINTQDEHHKMHIPLGSGGNTNADILDQNIKDATATPAKTDTLDQNIPFRQFFRNSLFEWSNFEYTNSM